MVKIILLRHGYTVMNKASRMCGFSESPLTEKGKIQGNIACEYIYNNYKVQKIVASTLSRAITTASRLVELTGLDLITDERLKEQDIGGWELKTLNEIEENYPENYHAWLKDACFVAPVGGENMVEVFNRSISAINDYVKECDQKDGVLVIVTHGGVVRALSTMLLGKDISEITSVPWVNNASITEFDYDNGKCNLIKFGFDDYLNGLQTKIMSGLK